MKVSELKCMGNTYDLFAAKDYSNEKIEQAYIDTTEEIQGSWNTPQQNLLRLMVLELEHQIKLRGGVPSYTGSDNDICEKIDWSKNG